MSWKDGDSGIENRNTFMVKSADKTGTGALVYQMDIDATLNPVPFDADETKVFEFEINSVYDFTGTLTGPAATTDYTANTLANGAGTDLTSQLTVTNETGRSLGHFLVQKVVWGGTAGFLTMMKQRADAYAFNQPTSTISEDATSQTTYRDRFKKIDCQFLDTQESAEEVGANRLARRKDPKTRLTLKLQGADKVTAHHMMQRRLSDLVTCVYTDMGINDTFHVEGESWTVDRAGFAVMQTLQLREA
jgi:hypothetical protein